MEKNKLKKLSDYHQEIMNCVKAQDMDGLSELNVIACAEYSWYAQQMIEIKLQKARVWDQIKYGVPDGEKKRSDVEVKQLWRQMEAGANEVRISYAMRSLEKIQSAIRTHLYSMDKELNYSKQ